MVWVLLILTGLLAGMLGSLMGLGGGIIVVPALMVFSGFHDFFSHITPQTAVGTSLLIMIFTGLSSTLAYMKKKTVDYVAGGIFIMGSGPGALFGVWLNKDMETAPFLILFGIFMIIISFILLIRNKLKPLKIKGKGIRRTYINAAGQEVEYGFQPVIGIAIAFVVGMCSGLFGIGGGSLMVPAMILLFGFPPHMAVATSMFLVLLSALISSVSHIVLGNVEWLFALALIPGAWIGAQIGANINQRLKSDTLVTILRVFLIIIGIRLMWQGITGM
ncbi:sulfite exporter TauE/SafE family protein [Salibacterium aidingense]|uniref:sulfite exporter TauE/SafE family protein n=1 Tax=Salibacterium aidingense TaxID=384933 RepID=UPI00041754BC|nr:sulfite exporter TauE/SafE family protein [Salibacterium aidingense]